MVTMAAAIASSGCIAFPFATPPIRTGVAIGPRLGSAGVDAPVVTHLGVHPLQLDRGLLDRPFDVGFGFVSETGANRSARGAYLEGSFAFVREPIAHAAIARASVGLVFRILQDDADPLLARGMGLRLALELSTYGQGPVVYSGRDGGFIGWAFGELGGGLFVEANYTQFGVDNVGQIVIGLQCRLPTAVGVAWAYYKGKKK